MNWEGIADSVHSYFARQAGERTLSNLSKSPKSSWHLLLGQHADWMRGMLGKEGGDCCGFDGDDKGLTTCCCDS